MTKKVVINSFRQRLNTDCGWDVLWKAVRVLRSFSRADLVITTGQSEHNVRDFTQTYRKAGYLAEKNGTWILIKDTGPQRPPWRDVKPFKEEEREE